MRNWIAMPLALGFVACGESQGTEPHDMSTVEHERAAGGEEAAAAQHGAQYDPSAGT